MASNRGQNLHLVASSCQLVILSCQLVISSCQLALNSSSRHVNLSSRRVVFSTRPLVLSTCHLVVSSSQLVVLTRHLFGSALSSRRVNSSPRHFNLSSRRVNSSSRRLVSRHFKYREDPGTEKTNCASSCTHERFCKMDELSAVKDILRDALSRIDQIPPQNSQNQNPSQSNQEHELPPSSNNTNVGLLARAQSNFR